MKITILSMEIVVQQTKSSNGTVNVQEEDLLQDLTFVMKFADQGTILSGTNVTMAI